MESLLFGRLSTLINAAAADVLALETDSAEGDYLRAAGRLAGLAEAAELLSGISSERLIKTARHEAQRRAALALPA